jgi:hypothetical protein
MLSWALSRNAAAAGAPDDSQIEQPDTPAPIFAARAIKSAIFGTPAPGEDKATGNVPPRKEADVTADSDLQLRSPAKGILLTPGTATARRKRVSFGHDVKNTKPAGIESDARGDKVGGSQPKSKVSEALEKSRKKQGPSTGMRKGDQRKPSTKDVQNPENLNEVEADDDFTDPNMTIDLNEPRSGSGKYWKSSFEQYHAEAKAEMEKLVKYKHLARSYAKEKDAESTRLHARLREEQERVEQMESKVNDLAREMLTKQKATGGGEEAFDEDLVDQLDRQSKLVSQYQVQVKELEALLAQTKSGTGSARAMRTISPKTEKTLLETKRELRRARADCKELASLREEVSRLRAAAAKSDEKIRDLKVDSKKLVEDLLTSKSEIRGLRSELSLAKGTIRDKDKEIANLRAEHDALKTTAKAEKTISKSSLGQQSENMPLKPLAPVAERSPLDADWQIKLRTLETKQKEEREKRLRQRTSSHKLETLSGFDEDALLQQHQEPRVPNRAPLLSRDAQNQKAHRASSASIRLSSKTDPAEASPSATRRSPEEERQTSEAALGVLTDIVNLSHRRATSINKTQRQTDAAGTTISRKVGNDLVFARSTTPVEDVPDIDTMEQRRTGKAQETRQAFNASILSMGSSKVDMPADRRAAALARLESKKREKSERAMLRNKENMAPRSTIF